MLAAGYVIPLGEVYKAFRMNLVPEKKIVSRNGKSYVTTVWVNPKSDKKLQQGSLFELEELDNPGLYKQKPQPRIGYLVKQRSRNLFEIRPLPGRLFSYNEKKALKEWLSSLGWEVVEDRTHLRAINPKGNGSMKIPDPLPSERQEAKMKKEAEKEERLERYRREREEYLNTSDTAKWIRDVFGGEDIVNKFNVYELGLFLDGKKRKFEGMMNWRWEEGLKKLGVEYKGKTYQEIAEQIKEKYRELSEREK